MKSCTNWSGSCQTPLLPSLTIGRHSFVSIALDLKKNSASNNYYCMSIAYLIPYCKCSRPYKLKMQTLQLTRRKFFTISQLWFAPVCKGRSLLHMVQLWACVISWSLSTEQCYIHLSINLLRFHVLGNFQLQWWRDAMSSSSYFCSHLKSQQACLVKVGDTHGIMKWHRLIAISWG